MKTIGKIVSLGSLEEKMNRRGGSAGWKRGPRSLWGHRIHMGEENRMRTKASEVEFKIVMGRDGIGWGRGWLR